MNYIFDDRFQMQSFVDGVGTPPADQYVAVDTTTYLLARDEDYENLFHTTADYVWSSPRIMLLDI